MKSDWAATLPPTNRATGDAPTGGVAADTNKLTLALAEVRLNVPNAAADVGAATAGHTHSGTGAVASPYGWYNVRDYGATGENATADTAGFQAAIDAMLAHPGSKLHIPPAPNDGSYLLDQTIDYFDSGSSNNQISHEIDAHLGWHGIMWVGGSNTSIFRSRGMKDCTVKGLHVVVQASSTNVVGWEMDVGVFGSVTYNSTGRVRFVDSHFFTNASSSSVIGWRMSHSSNTADVSMVEWDNCHVQGDPNQAAGSRTSIGWVWEGSNTLNCSWFNSSASYCGKGWSTQPTTGSAGTHGGDCMYWYGCGGSYNDLIFDTKTTGTYTSVGGRWEEGRQFIKVDQASYAGHTSWTIIGNKLETFAPPAGRLIEIGSACTLKIIGGSIRLLSTAADTDMIYATTATGAFGFISLEGVGLPGDAPSGGSTTTGPTWVGGVTTGTGTWRVEMVGCMRTNSSNEVVSTIHYRS